MDLADGRVRVRGSGFRCVETWHEEHIEMNTLALSKTVLTTLLCPEATKMEAYTQ